MESALHPSAEGLQGLVVLPEAWAPTLVFTNWTPRSACECLCPSALNSRPTLSLRDSKFASYPLYPSWEPGNFLVSSVAHNSRRNLWSQIQSLLCPTTHHNHFCSGLASPILGKSRSCSPRVPDGKERNICLWPQPTYHAGPTPECGLKTYHEHSSPGLPPSPVPLSLSQLLCSSRRGHLLPFPTSQAMLSPLLWDSQVTNHCFIPPSPSLGNKPHSSAWRLQSQENIILKEKIKENLRYAKHYSLLCLAGFSCC